VGGAPFGGGTGRGQGRRDLEEGKIPVKILQELLGEVLWSAGGRVNNLIAKRGGRASAKKEVSFWTISFKELRPKKNAPTKKKKPSPGWEQMLDEWG